MLDTSIASELIREPLGHAAQRARRMENAVSISVIVAAELRFGARKRRSARLSDQVEQLLSEISVLPVEAPIDAIYAEIRVGLEAGGRPIGSNDLLIAAHALALDATLATANTSEFERVPGLIVENWRL